MRIFVWAIGCTVWVGVDCADGVGLFDSCGNVWVHNRAVGVGAYRAVGVDAYRAVWVGFVIVRSEDRTYHNIRTIQHTD